MKADLFIQGLIECHQKDGNTVILRQQGTENNRDFTFLQISIQRDKYYLIIFSSSDTKEILFFKTFGEIPFMQTILNNIKTKKTFHGFEVLKYNVKFGSLMTPTVIEILALTRMERSDMLTEEDMREFSMHFPIDRMVGILNKQNWTKRGVDFLYGEIASKREHDQYLRDREQALQDNREHNNWVNDCRDQARNMGYDV